MSLKDNSNEYLKSNRFQLKSIGRRKGFLTAKSAFGMTIEKFSVFKAFGLAAQKLRSSAAQC